MGNPSVASCSVQRWSPPSGTRSRCTSARGISPGLAQPPTQSCWVAQSPDSPHVLAEHVRDPPGVPGEEYGLRHVPGRAESSLRSQLTHWSNRVRALPYAVPAGTTPAMLMRNNPGGNGNVVKRTKPAVPGRSPEGLHPCTTSLAPPLWLSAHCGGAATTGARLHAEKNTHAAKTHLCTRTRTHTHTSTYRNPVCIRADVWCMC